MLCPFLPFPTILSLSVLPVGSGRPSTVRIQIDAVVV